jgi:hypothetical protein
MEHPESTVVISTNSNYRNNSREPAIRKVSVEANIPIHQDGWFIRMAGSSGWLVHQEGWFIRMAD